MLTALFILFLPANLGLVCHPSNLSTMEVFQTFLLLQFLTLGGAQANKGIENNEGFENPSSLNNESEKITRLNGNKNIYARVGSDHGMALSGGSDRGEIRDENEIQGGGNYEDLDLTEITTERTGFDSSEETYNGVQGLAQRLVQGVEDQGLDQELDPIMEDRGLDQGLDQGLKDRGLDQRLYQGLEQGLDQELDQKLDQGLDRGLNLGLDQGQDQGLDWRIYKYFQDLELATDRNDQLPPIRGKRAVDTFPRGSGSSLSFTGVGKEKERELNALAALDVETAILEFIESVSAMSASGQNCSARLNFELTRLIRLDELFRAEMVKAIQTANMLNNMFRNPPEVIGLREHFYMSLARGLVGGSDSWIFGAGIIFDPAQMPNPQRPITPYIHRESSPGVMHTRNIAKESRSRYAVNGTDGYDWFWKQRKDYSSLLWEHRSVCAKVKVGDDPLTVADLATVVTSTAQGLWGNLQMDCSVGRVWTVAYSVPFFGCTMQKSLVFK